MRILKFILLITFSISSLAIHAREKRNFNLGDYVYNSLEIFSYAYSTPGPTLTPQTARENHIKTITAYRDSLNNFALNNFAEYQMDFDQLGRCVGFRYWEWLSDCYHDFKDSIIGRNDFSIHYDSKLGKKGISRIDNIILIYSENGKWWEKDSTVLKYDDKGRLTRIKTFYLDTNSRNTEPEYETETIFSYWEKGYCSYAQSVDNSGEINWLLKYNKINHQLCRTSFSRRKGQTVRNRFRRVKPPFTKNDFASGHREGLDCVDTIPSCAAFLQIHGYSEDTWIWRDSSERIIEIWQPVSSGFIFNYNSYGLPESEYCVWYNDHAPYSAHCNLKFTYSYFPE